MNRVKKTAEYTVYQKRSGRYAVKGKDRKLIHGDEKAEILFKEGLIRRSLGGPKPTVEAAAESSESTGESS